MSLTPFSTILIANRGEIALRVMRSARALGLRCVAVYADVERDARHVREADQAVCIGAALPAQSYLRIEALLEAARLAGADAVHPGYGFLAENAAFAQACCDAGLVFIGPSPEAMRAMGHKAGAKRLMREAGVPCIPGYLGADQSEARLAQEAEAIGYPLMIKAVAGGGGRGMRLVNSAAEFAERLRSAQSEAQHAFGDAQVMLERALIEPRHIEIQVVADRHGNAIHLGERDCSVQRRHQKLIEESPSPAVDAALRERMGATALAAAQAIGYEGAGTLEFLLDREGHYYFMEMNTRLQVEHPVTEAVTGLDLVELQLRVAAGEALPLTQQQLRFDGHAIELRLCAEDAGHGFMPQSGRLALWRAPRGLRVEHALDSGTPIPPYYDSMIAKLVSHGASRDEARRRLLRGLEELVALGVTTNQVFLARCLAHPVFVAGAATTAFVEQQLDQLLAPDSVALARAAALAAVLLQQPSGAPSPGRLRAQTLAVPLRFSLNGLAHEGHVSRHGDQAYEVLLGERRHALELLEFDPPQLRFICDGLMENAVMQRDESTLWLHYRGLPLRIDDQARITALRQGEGGGDGKLRASTTGRVAALPVAVGDRVSAGQPLLTLEAMKMEHVHAAPCAGTVSAVHVALGEQCAAGRIVVEVVP